MRVLSSRSHTSARLIACLVKVLVGGPHAHHRFGHSFALVARGAERGRGEAHSAIIARRNAAIFDFNAWPKMGGAMPRAPREQYE